MLRLFVEQITTGCLLTSDAIEWLLACGTAWSEATIGNANHSGSREACKLPHSARNRYDTKKERYEYETGYETNTNMIRPPTYLRSN